jgi:hypothetical protein
MRRVPVVTGAMATCLPHMHIQGGVTARPVARTPITCNAILYVHVSSLSGSPGAMSQDGRMTWKTGESSEP